MKTTKKGFTIVEILLALLVVAVIGFGGYYVWQNQHKTNTTTTARDLVAYRMPVEKMSFSYDGAKWNIESKSSSTDPCSGDKITLVNGKFELVFRISVVCNGGGGGCFISDPETCIFKSLKDSTIQLSNTEAADLIYTRESVDSGSSWSNEITLTTSTIDECKDFMCTFKSHNIKDAETSSAIEGRIYGAYTDGTDESIASIDQFTKLPEVMDAAKILKTVHY